MRLYLSGPMTGLPDHNRAAFAAATTRFRDLGHFVINPAELSEQFGKWEDVSIAFEKWYEYGGALADEFLRIVMAVMQADIAALRSCDAIYLLRGWETSRGAKKELAEAIAHGLTIMQEGDAT